MVHLHYANTLVLSTCVYKPIPYILYTLKLYENYRLTRATT